jgi:hypothetical protein
VVAINWGPWSAIGMASPAVEAQFRARGITPIPVAEGVKAAIRELANPGRDDAIVVLGDGPWRPAGREPDEAATELKKPA